MTVINNIDIDEPQKTKNRTTQAIINNEPIDDVLHVVTMVSNPCLFGRRYLLAKQFIERMENTDNIKLYVVEILYKNQHKFMITKKNNPQHLQLRVDTPLWHKENALNIGIKKLLPSNWKACAWVDADIEFDNVHWALDTLKVLNGMYDVVQLFSHVEDMDKNCLTMSMFHGFGYQFSTGRPYVNAGINFWHPGYGWACTRKAYEKMGGIYELSILGSGDHNMAYSFINRGTSSVNNKVHSNYIDSVKQFEKKVKNLRIGYVPGIIKHYFHGSKKNRKYTERWMILVENQYDPIEHITKNEDGLLIPTDKCPQKLLDDILNYFFERNEDEGFAEN
ncbi:hypothetical protein BMW23_0649 [Bodo saltans virus]|jgi:hypothetical protein|uniref:Uncharacterized protein n=1 Tax=Bodo saltans virus TaxID=2024608 RepID=A0A2H4UV36_9VIRU|nr:hypothetical protein QJ851_gp0632 [Bodo saltans virus]ATZ80695.1 hypothetical protein BMW23_0649 [Bodo saltans virus]